MLLRLLYSLYPGLSGPEFPERDNKVYEIKIIKNKNLTLWWRHRTGQVDGVLRQEAEDADVGQGADRRQGQPPDSAAGTAAAGAHAAHG